MEPHILKIWMIVLVMGVFAYLLKHVFVWLVLGPEDNAKGFSQSEYDRDFLNNKMTSKANSTGFRSKVAQKKPRELLASDASGENSIFHGVQNGEPDIVGIWTVDEH